MDNLINIEAYPVRPVLDRLLQDKTTKQNIIFATDAYLLNGPEFAETAQITADKLLGYPAAEDQPNLYPEDDGQKDGGYAGNRESRLLR